jgi:alanyl-tRNA synthetase
VVTIDLAGGNLAAEQVQQAEDLTNAVLRSKLPVRCQEVAPDAVPAAQLRKLPQVDKDIRLIEIAGFDLCPCGGTHVRDLGEIGLLKVVGSENKRGNLRIAFLAGQRAYRDYGIKHNQLASLSALLSEPLENAVPAVERVLAKVNELERECSHLRERVLTLEADDFRAAAEALGNVACIVRELPEHSLAEAKFLAGYLAEQGATIVIFGLPDEPYRLVATASANVGIAIGGLLKATVAQYGGKGGGSSTSAQGAVPCSSGQITLKELAQACAKALND